MGKVVWARDYPHVYLTPHTTLSPRPTPLVFAYRKRSKTGGGNGLGTSLTVYTMLSLHFSSIANNKDLHAQTISEPLLKRPRYNLKSTTVQDAYWSMPGLISCTGVARTWRVLSHAWTHINSLTKKSTLLKEPVIGYSSFRDRGYQGCHVMSTTAHLPLRIPPPISPFLLAQTETFLQSRLC